MNCSIRIVSALLLISCIVSCKKDKDEPNTPTTPRLSKMTQWNLTTSGKEIETKEFIYDNQKRLVEIATSVGDSVGGVIKNTYNTSWKFFYNGNETNPYKTTGNDAYYIYSSDRDVFHFYNSNGEILKDSINTPSYNSTTVRTYNYSPGKIMIEIKEKSSSATTITWDSLLLADHNIKEAFLTIYGFPSAGIGYKMTYDNKINPFSTLNIASLFTANIRYGFGTIMSPGYCKNNLTEFKTGISYGVNDFTQNAFYTIAYTYNDANLPIECRFSNVNYSYVIKYEYID